MVVFAKRSSYPLYFVDSYVALLLFNLNIQVYVCNSFYVQSTDNVNAFVTYESGYGKRLEPDRAEKISCHLLELFPVNCTQPLHDGSKQFFSSYGLTDTGRLDAFQ